MAAETSKLDNGLTVLSVPGTGSVTAMIFVAAGSRHETRDVAGTAHFLEHLFFKGTPRYPSTQLLAAHIDSFGSLWNAYTSKEYTGYHIKGAAEYVAESVETLADLLKNALIPTEEVEREKGVVLQELKMNRDQPASLAYRLLNEALYGDTPLGWDVIGFPEVITGLSRDEIVAYRGAFYSPELMTLVLAGPVTHEQARTLALAHLAELTPHASPAALPGKLGTARTRQEHRPIEQAVMQLAFPGVSYADSERDYLALELATLALGGSMSSRLFIGVRERQGLCYNIRANLVAYSDVGTLQINTGVEPARAAQALRSIVEEVERLAAEGLSAVEAAKARAIYKGRYVIGGEDSKGLAHRAVTDLLYLGRVRSQDEVFSLVESVDRTEMTASVARVFVPGEARLAVVGPDSVDAETLLSKARAIAA